jgi:hypothetical protein
LQKALKLSGPESQNNQVRDYKNSEAGEHHAHGHANHGTQNHGSLAPLLSLNITIVVVEVKEECVLSAAVRDFN